MGDALKSIFFWVQIYHFWECLKVLELVKYRWEPSDFVKMIVCSAALLLGLKQLFPNMIFLGSPMVRARGLQRRAATPLARIRKSVTRLSLPASSHRAPPLRLLLGR